MKPQTRYFTALTAPYARRAAAFGTTRRTTASVPTADSNTTAANARLCRASNAKLFAQATRWIRRGLSLANPQSHGNHWVWEAKGGGKTAEIRADGERVGTVRCGG